MKFSHSKFAARRFAASLSLLSLVVPSPRAEQTTRLQHRSTRTSFKIVAKRIGSEDKAIVPAISVCDTASPASEVSEDARCEKKRSTMELKVKKAQTVSRSSIVG
jgi:hypothetical protein